MSPTLVHYELRWNFDSFNPIFVVFCLVFIMTMFFASGCLFLPWPSNENTPCNLVVYSVSCGNMPHVQCGIK